MRPRINKFNILLSLTLIVLLMPQSVAASVDIYWESDFEEASDWTLHSYDYNGDKFSQIDTKITTDDVARFQNPDGTFTEMRSPLGYMDVNDAERSTVIIERFHEAWHDSDVGVGEWSFKWTSDGHSLDFFAFMVNDPSGDYNFDEKSLEQMDISAYMLLMVSGDAPNVFERGGALEPQMALAQYDEGEFSILDSYKSSDLDKPNRFRIFHDDYDVLRVMYEGEIILSAKAELNIDSEKVWFGSWMGNSALDLVKVSELVDGVIVREDTITVTSPQPEPEIVQMYQWAFVTLAAVILAVPLTYYLRMRNFALRGRTPLTT
ncbi:MAG: hypothetical protein ACXAE3_00100 [Candidatus Kariarchaeaceae archaeon]